MKRGRFGRKWVSFRAIRAAWSRAPQVSGVTSQERDFAIQQIVSRAVVSTEIVDILKAAGIQSPDISILSDEFLAEVQQMQKKNLALEALRKLINDGIQFAQQQSQHRRNADLSRNGWSRVARYHANAITTAEVLAELDPVGERHPRGAATWRGSGPVRGGNRLLRCTG
ncbi:MAG: DUF3387 domain-containing protein [Lysobacteraceae bacterium]